MNNTKLILLLIASLVLAYGCTEKTHSVMPTEDTSPEISTELTVVTFELVLKSEYDMDAIKESRFIHEDVQFLFVEVVTRQSDLEFLAREGEFSYPRGIDFDNYIVLIAYGRGIAEAAYNTDEFTYHHFGPRTVVLSITFKEDYFGETVFIYRANRDSNRAYLPTIYGVHCYIANGAERIYIGSDIGTFNRPKRAEGEYDPIPLD